MYTHFGRVIGTPEFLYQGASIHIKNEGRLEPMGQPMGVHTAEVCGATYKALEKLLGACN